MASPDSPHARLAAHASGAANAAQRSPPRRHRSCAYTERSPKNAARTAFRAAHQPAATACPGSSAKKSAARPETHPAPSRRR